MSSAIVSRWGRRFLLAGGLFLVTTGLAGVGGLSHRTIVVLGLQGFVLTVIFGKAYSLLPSYFDRTLRWPYAPAVQLPLHVGGVIGLAAVWIDDIPAIAGDIGAILWAAGVAVFLAAMGATIADNPLGGETGTSEANVDRATLDRIANGFMPIVLAYLALGTFEVLSGRFGGPTVVGSGVARTTHLFGAGVGALLLFSVGFRLLPRFLVTQVSHRLAAVVLTAGALGPVLIAVGMYDGPVFVLGATLETIAVTGFAAAYLRMYLRSDRGRVGFYGPLLGVVAGVAAVGLGLQFAVAGMDSALVTAHRRLNIFGFLGLSILGIGYQFYPPTVGNWPASNNHTAAGGLGLVALGMLGAAFGAMASPVVAQAGFAAVAAGGAVWVYLLSSAIATQIGGR